VRGFVIRPDARAAHSDLTAIVTVTEAAAATGVCAAENRMRPPGDIRNAHMVALAKEEALLSAVSIRVQAGPRQLTRPQFRNLFIAALST